MISSVIEVFTQPLRLSPLDVVPEACRPKFLVSTLLPTRSGEWQTNTEIAHLHFKAAIVHFLPDLQFGGATSGGRRKYASRARRGRLCSGSVGGDEGEGEGGVEIAMGVVRSFVR